MYKSLFFVIFLTLASLARKKIPVGTVFKTYTSIPLVTNGSRELSCTLFIKQFIVLDEEKKNATGELMIV